MYLLPVEIVKKAPSITGQSANSSRHVDTEKERPLYDLEIMRACKKLGLDGELHLWTDFSVMTKIMPVKVAVKVVNILGQINALDNGRDIFCILAKKQKMRVI